MYLYVIFEKNNIQMYNYRALTIFRLEGEVNSLSESS